MTLFVSVALFRREGRMTFRAPRKEASQTATQARKSASRYWNNMIREPDKLTKIIVVSSHGQIMQASEHDGGRRWVDYSMSVTDAAALPHLAACLGELGVDAEKVPPALPDVIEINGAVYRREI